MVAMQKQTILWVAAVALPFLMGCASSRPVRFYTLQPAASAAPADAISTSLTDATTVAVLPIDVPAYLRRTHIITRPEGAELVVAEFNRWAAPLEENLTRALVDHLVARLPAYQFQARPTGLRETYRYELQVRVSRFEGPLGGPVILEGEWTLRRPAQKGQSALGRRVRLSRSANGASHGAQVAAMSALVGDFAEDIAEGLRNLGANEPGAEEPASTPS